MKRRVAGGREERKAAASPNRQSVCILNVIVVADKHYQGMSKRREYPLDQFCMFVILSAGWLKSICRDFQVPIISSPVSEGDDFEVFNT